MNRNSQRYQSLATNMDKIIVAVDVPPTPEME
jgi:hypothetical protein